MTATPNNIINAPTPFTLPDGGTGSALVDQPGAVAYSTSSGMAFTAVTATIGQMLRSGGSGAPSYSTNTWAATNNINQLAYGTGLNAVGFLATVVDSSLVTDGSGNVSWASTLPAAVQGNITTFGNISAASSTVSISTISAANQPTVLAALGTNQTSVTGDGATVTVVWGSAPVNTGTMMDTTTGIATFATAGMWEISGVIDITQLTSAMTSLNLTHILTSGNKTAWFANPAAIMVSNEVILPFSIIYDSSISDTWKLELTISNGASNAATINAGSSYVNIRKIN